MIDFNFSPDGKRAFLINQNMRGTLADTLEYLGEELSSSFTFDKSKLQIIIKNLKNGSDYSCFLFALYTKLILLIDNEKFDEVQNILTLLTKQIPLHSNTPQYVTLDAKEFMGYGTLLAELMNIEEGTDFRIVSLDSGSYSSFEVKLNDAFKMIDQYLSELGFEIRSLVTQIIMVEPSNESKLSFAGGSSYMLWGGLFLNAHSHNTTISLVEVLAHETSHMLLFGFASEEPLTKNPDSVRYSSPLRYEERPMEGIYHAMFASARMFWSMHSLLENDDLSNQDKQYAQKAIDTHIKSYSDAYNVVKENAVLTRTGKRIFEETFLYMKPYLINIEK